LEGFPKLGQVAMLKIKLIAFSRNGSVLIAMLIYQPYVVDEPFWTSGLKTKGIY